VRLTLNIHHYFEGPLTMNDSLSTQLSALVADLAAKDSTISSLSSVIEGGAASVSTAISSAVDEEDTAVAASISSALSAG